MKKEVLLRAEKRFFKEFVERPLKFEVEFEIKNAFSCGAEWMYNYILYLLKRVEKELQESMIEERERGNKELYETLLNELATIRAVLHYTLKWEKQPVQKEKRTK